jgi:hypothetical protein
LTNSSRPEDKRKKRDDECLLTITFRWESKQKSYSFHDDSELRSWYLSPIVVDPKDTLTIAYKDGTRIHFPLCNIESYRVEPRKQVKSDAETPPAVHN